MSDLAYKGNPLGTGTITLETPNTNTDRTLTLPDAAGEVLTSASSLDSSKLTGALPAIDGSALTNLPVNQDRTAYRYWKYVCRESILSHHPRVARLVMIDEGGTTTNINTFVSDNCSDSGTIPNSGNAWTYDFGTPTIITRAGGYVTYNGGARGAWIAIYGSTDNATWVFQGVFPFNAYDCGIVTGEF